VHVKPLKVEQTNINFAINASFESVSSSCPAVHHEIKRLLEEDKTAQPGSFTHGRSGATRLSMS